MSEEICKTKCPQCKKTTKGNKKIGIHMAELTGRGMKATRRKDADDTDD